VSSNLPIHQMCHDAVVAVAVAVVVGVDNGRGVWWDDKNKERGFKSKLFISDKKNEMIHDHRFLRDLDQDGHWYRLRKHRVFNGDFKWCYFSIQSNLAITNSQGPLKNVCYNCEKLVYLV